MDVSEQYQKVHSYPPPVRSVVDVPLPEVSGEHGLLVCLVYQGKLHSPSPGLIALLLDKVLREDQPFQLGDLAISGSCIITMMEGRGRILSTYPADVSELPGH